MIGGTFLRRKKILVLSGIVLLLAIFILTMTSFLHKKAEKEPVMLYEQELFDYLTGILSPQEQEMFAQTVEDQLTGRKAVDNDRLLALFTDFIRMNEGCGMTEQKAFVVSMQGDAYTLCDQEGELFVCQMVQKVQDLSKYYLPGESGEVSVGNTLSFWEKDGSIVLLADKSDQASTMKKAWVVANDENLRVLYRGSEFSFPKSGISYTGYEDIADITLEDGVVRQVEPYQTKIHGKLLSLKEEEGAYRIELAQEILTGTADMQVYDVCSGEANVTVGDLTVGYDLADFVLDGEGRCVAALIARKEKMDTIRVLIRTNNFEEPFHSSVTLRGDTDCEIQSGDEVITLKAGEEVTITPESEWFTSDRIIITPKAYTGRISMVSLKRSQGIPGFRGTIELERTGDGVLVVNELPLEEYLYSVVPSEMPAGYPIEALKAQAVSARTYAYAHMRHSGMQKYGAHVDDSAAFQVYNNINEAEATTRAVRETEGMILTYQGEIATTYFYSTSCGYGTDMTAWTCEDKADTKDSYLVAKRIADDTTQADPADTMRQEEAFAAFLQADAGDCFEAKDTYFRWRYQTELDEALFWETLGKRYEASAENVLTKTDQGYESLPVSDSGRIKDIEIVRRAEGGAAIELCITGEHHTYKVLTEKNIRYMLAGSNHELILGADGEKSGSVNGMLPSAFAVLEKEYDETGNWLTGITVNGGGFGHGIGMSQNGARAMADAGYSYQDILAFFYENAVIGSYE